MFTLVGIIVIIILAASLRIAQEYQRAVVFRLGRFVGVRGPGLYFLLPFLEWQRTIDMRTMTVSIERQEAITKDSVTVKVNAVLWYKVVDPERAVVAVENYASAVYGIATTTVRNIIGQHQLDEVLKERDKINKMLREMVDKATNAWGVDVEMVETKDVEMPEQMQRAMAREAEATREKRARIIKAEAEKEAALKLQEASEMISSSPYALELRRMQMISEVGVDQNTTTIVMMPSEFVVAARNIADTFKKP